MFGFNANKVKELEFRNSILDDRVDNLERTLEIVEKQRIELLKTIDDMNVDKCENVFDFTNKDISVFVVERNKDNYGNWRTIIGYTVKIDKDGKVHEWSMSTTIKEHNRLVKEFENSKEPNDESN